MTTPQEEQPRDEPASTPTVSTAPARSRPWWSSVPSHVGPARTSTLVLAALFLLIGALYLNVRPEPTGTATRGGTSDVQSPAGPAPTTVAPTTTVPEATTTPPTATTEEPTTEATTEATTDTPTDETPPEETTDTLTTTTPPPSTQAPTTTIGSAPPT